MRGFRQLRLPLQERTGKERKSLERFHDGPALPNVRRQGKQHRIPANVAILHSFRTRKWRSGKVWILPIWVSELPDAEV
ncbi:MAG: hypothetical protein OSB05_15140 [Akkermansiaceae bacterium]|nr:hypothetical protein [Akkermansiaceae bacterium]